LLWSSVFFSWAIVLRPYLALIVGIFALYYLFNKKILFSEIIKLGTICILPLLLLITPWALRNYFLFRQFIPFQQDKYAGYGYTQSELQSRKLIAALGEDGTTYWDLKAMASYFHPDFYKKSSFQYSKYLVRDTTFINDLEKIRYSFINNYYSGTAVEDELLVSQMKELNSKYKKKYPFRYFLINNFKKILKFWGHSGSSYLPANASNKWFKILEIVNKLIQSLLYYTVLIFGTYGLWKFRKHDKIGYVLLMPILVLTLLFPLFFKLFEPRYSFPFYYPCLIGLCLLIQSIFKKLSFLQ